MNKEEAIALATKVIESEQLGEVVDISKPFANFIPAKGDLAKLRKALPQMDLDFEVEDFWAVDFPFLAGETFGRSGLAVEVDPVSRNAKLMEH